MWYSESMRFTRLGRLKRSRIVQCFIEDVDATTAAKLSLVNRKTVNSWYRELRRRLLPFASQYQSESGRLYRSFETKRLAKFYGLRPRDMPYHVAETRLRFTLGKRYRTLIIDIADDLLSD